MLWNRNGKANLATILRLYSQSSWLKSKPIHSISAAGEFWVVELPKLLGPHVLVINGEFFILSWVVVVLTVLLAAAAIAIILVY